MQSVTLPYITSHQDATHFWFTGTLTRILAESGKTDGAFSLVHQTLPLGNATPLHIHHAHDEAFFVLFGDLKGVLGDTEWSATGGDFVWLPRGVAHAFQAVSEIPTEVLVMSVPGGFDDFVANAGDLYEEGMETSHLGPDPALLTEIASQHDIAIIGPPVNFLG
jgi:mannose-6-phosphate isomerase-like protein (cupin superfamily)